MKNYYGNASTWAQKHGLKLYGDEMHDNIKRDYRGIVSNMQTLRYAQQMYDKRKDKELYKIIMSSIDLVAYWKSELRKDKERTNKIDRTR